MSYFSFDRYWAKREAQEAMLKDAEAQEALDHALTVARGIVDDCLRRWEAAGSPHGLTVNIEAGQYDQPVFVFYLLMDYGEGATQAEVRREELGRLLRDVWEQIIGSEVDYWWNWDISGMNKPSSGEGGGE